MRFADFFCGAGGLSLGFREAGHTPVFAVDFDKDSITTYHENFCGYVHGTECHCLRADVLKIDPFDFPAADIYIGGPPCQGFSVAGKQDPNDLRNQLPYVMLDFVKERRPTIVLIENVPGAVKMGLHRELLFRLSLLGYCVDYRILNAADYGVPQTRKRMFVQARLDGPVIWPNPTHCDPRKPVEGLLPWVTAGVALDGMPWPQPNTYPATPVTETHWGNREIRADKPSPTLTATEGGGGTNNVPFIEARQRFPHGLVEADKPAPIIKAGGNIDRKGHLGGAAPPSLIARKSSEAEIRHNLEHGIRNVIPSKPSPTLQARDDIYIFETDGGTLKRMRAATSWRESGVVVRRLTAAECAALQSFPQWFKFMGSRTSQYKQIGNAVPPLLARRIGECL